MNVQNKRKHCVLVVDDEPAVCDSVHDLLRREFRVIKASSAQEGARILLEEDVHIVMTDQRMPRMSGLQLLESAKARSPHAVRLLFTGFADPESIIGAINQGHVFQFLKKPWNPEDLMEAIRDAAAEYERIEAANEESTRLRDQIDQLTQRVSFLEKELQSLAANRPAASATPLSAP
jgi:response regulator RpfG family c-di-GMP phosphodiesterase